MPIDPRLQAGGDRPIETGGTVPMSANLQMSGHRTTGAGNSVDQQDYVTRSELDASGVPKTRNLTAGTGITGGGTLAADRTFAADFGTGTGKVTQGDDVRLNPTYIAAPALPYDADRTFLQMFTALEAVTLWAPTATRKLDPRTVTQSMAGTIVKTGTGAFGLTIDVTSGGNQGWTTPAGLNTDYTLSGSANAAAGSWLYVIDLPRTIIYLTPVA